MRKFVYVALASCTVAAGGTRAAEPATETVPAGTAPATAADVEALRQQVQSLTAMVQALQQQVKDQQAAREKNSSTASTLPQNPETESAETTGSPAPAASAPPLFPTTDSSVVAGPSSVSPNAKTSATFPTTDESVTANSGPESETATGSALAQPIPVIGGRNKSYMNISFDGLFTLAGSGARDVSNVEVGDHDPQQRGFNARNAE